MEEHGNLGFVVVAVDRRRPNGEELDTGTNLVGAG